MPSLLHVLAALITLAAPAAPLPPPGIIDGTTAKQLQARGATVVDVRSVQEFQSGHVPGSINIPHDQLATRGVEVGAKDHPVVVYCRSGRRSALAATVLASQGFTAVYDFKSIEAWPGPVETGPARAR